MTLVLALRCREGVVLASDGQATCDAAGQPTREPTRKLFDVDGRLAWGAAGSVGLQQTLAEELARTGVPPGGATATRQRIADIVVPVQQRALANHVSHFGAAQPELSCVFCWCDRDGPRILSLPRTGGDHRFHDRYAAVGSGDIFAAFALRSVADAGEPELALEQAKMVAYKAVADAIDVAAIYLGPPIQMVVVTAAGTRELSRDELDGPLADSVAAWRARLREQLGALEPAAAVGPDRRLAPAHTEATP